MDGQLSAADFLQRSGRTLFIAEAVTRDRRSRVTSGPLLEALEIIFAGSAAEGRWLNGVGEPCAGHDAEARWVAYEFNEQTAWVANVAHIAKDALAQVDGYLVGRGDAAGNG